MAHAATPSVQQLAHAAAGSTKRALLAKFVSAHFILHPARDTGRVMHRRYFFDMLWLHVLPLMLSKTHWCSK
jgi:hypothetical protein